MNPNESAALDPTRRFAALTPDDLRRCAPSTFAEHARPGVSARYAFVSTAQVVGLLAAEGWEPVRASEQRVRLDARAGYQLHEIRLARRADLEAGALPLGGTRPEMIIQNAHDGTRAYRIDAGLYRLVCRNGLTVADADFAHVSIRHVDVSADAFARAARAVAENAPRAAEAVARWRAVHLSPVSRYEFASRAAALRWEEHSPVLHALHPDRLLAARRRGDSGLDLWTTFNVVQENLERGGVRYFGRLASGLGQRNQTHPIGGLSEGQGFNKALWALAGEFAGN